MLLQVYFARHFVLDSIARGAGALRPSPRVHFVGFLPSEEELLQRTMITISAKRRPKSCSCHIPNGEPSSFFSRPMQVATNPSIAILLIQVSISPPK